MKRKGKLIVIEGLDAAGKKTQAEILVRKLKARIFSFPSYSTPIGSAIQAYLRGRLGGRDALPPDAAAVLFSLDRLQWKQEIEGTLSAGRNVVADRYSQSNLYQAARVKGKKRREFISWLDDLDEGLPKADAVIFLDVPVRTAGRLMKKRGRKKDAHESDRKFQEEVRKIYLAEARKRKWVVVECTRNGRIRAKKEIAKEIIVRLKKQDVI